MSSKRKDLTKETFGKLKPLEIDVNRTIRGKTYWICECECGNKKSISYGNLRSGHTNSCGCWRRQLKWKGYQEISKRYWADCWHGAEARNLEFTITIEEAWDIFIKQDRKCALTGREIYFEHKEVQRKRNQTASLDRIDSNKGYIPGNVCWLHRRINYLKGNLHSDDFIKICQEVVDFQKKSGSILDVSVFTRLKQ